MLLPWLSRSYPGSPIDTDGVVYYPSETGHPEELYIVPGTGSRTTHYISGRESGMVYRVAPSRRNR